MNKDESNGFLYSPKLWVLGLLVSLCAAIGAIALIGKQVPALDLDISFSQSQAVAAAKNVQAARFPELEVTREAGNFGRDRHLQNYIELEAGGLKAFRDIVHNPNFAPYAWNVRLFKPGQQEEFRASFTPAGEPLSFRYEMPQNTEGAALDEGAARALAESQARKFIGERFDQYQLLETGSLTQPNDRIDYTFTYKHQTLVVGEAHPRIELEVKGDTLVRVHPYNHIPEAFNLRFAKMRELNQLISQFSSMAMVLFLVVGGLIPGAIWLVRKHQLKWWAGAKLALVVAAGGAAAHISGLPLMWMGYATTDTAANFLQKIFLDAGIGFVASLAMLATLFAVAEGLSRQAFTNQPRLFSAFKVSSASSYEVLGRVGGGYIWTGFFLLYAVGFIMLMQALGGWSPRELGADPNVLANWRPALPPIFQALSAGTWEECLFRAIPLSGAVLLGRHFGKVKLFVAVTLVLQAVVFAGAHANYPQLPGYSRLVELLIPALVFGLVFLRFGLIPCIAAHFLYDLVLMSSPLFAAQGDGLWLDRVLVIVAGLLPLGFCLWARIKAGAWQRLPDAGYNHFQPYEPRAPERVNPQTPQAKTGRAWHFPIHYAGMLLVAGVVLMAVALFVQRPSPLTPFTADRVSVLERADQVMAEHGVTEQAGWLRAARIEDGGHEAKRYVWYEASDAEQGRPEFHQLLGRYLEQPNWAVTYRQFTGPVELRQESWTVWMTPAAEVIFVSHELPEAATGASLTQSEVLDLARQRIRHLGWTDPNQLELISAHQTERESRTDWTITFADRQAFAHDDAYAQIWLKYAGDQLVGQARGVHVPEAHQRETAQKSAAKTPWKVVSVVSGVLLVILALFGFFYRRPNRGPFLFKAPLLWCSVLALVFFLNTFFWRHQTILGFQTTISLQGQWWGMWIGVGIGAVLFGAIMLVVLQPVFNVRPVQRHLSRDLLWGLAMACAFVGANQLLWRYLPVSDIPVLNTGQWASSNPWLASITGSIHEVLMALPFVSLCIGIGHFVRGRWQLGVVTVLALIWAVTQALSGWHFTADVVHNLVVVFFTAGAVYLARYRELGVILAALGFYFALAPLNSAVHAQYPGAPLYGLLAAMFGLALTAALVWHWYSRSQPAPSNQTPDRNEGLAQ